MSISERRYSSGDIAGFRFTKAEHGIFSNMHPDFPISVPTASAYIRVDSSETVYQVLKFPSNPEAQALIIAAGTPKGGKQAARAIRSGLRQDWDGPGRISAMRLALRLKLAQHRDAVCAALEATGDRPIVEISNKDAFWGAKPVGNDLFIGCNALGRLWMELREELRIDPEAYLERVCAPGMGHHLLGEKLVDWQRSEEPGLQAAFDL